MFFSRYYKILYKQSDIDKAEIEAMNEDKTKYLQKAVENYLKCLKYGDKHDLRIFRLISLWFSNTSVQDVNSLIEVRYCGSHIRGEGVLNQCCSVIHLNRMSTLINV